jgi:hypothetical protein
MCRRDGTHGRFGGGGRGWVSFLTFLGLRGDFVGGAGSGHFVFGMRAQKRGDFGGERIRKEGSMGEATA